MYVQEFYHLCKRHPYENKGIFYSELFLFLSSCSFYNVETIIESGTYKGYATRILADAWHTPIHTIDRTQVLKTEGNIIAYEGEAPTIIPSLMVLKCDTKIGVLIDGPKGHKALDLKDYLFQHPQVQVVAIHDLPEGHGETYHSHQEFNDRPMLDALVTEPYKSKYPKGPGLAVWERQ